MKFHPVCELFPEMQPDDFDALLENIKTRGVQVPVLVYQGQIIDGRHRWLACEKLGIECPKSDWHPRHGESLVEFVVSLNLHRRTLTASQRAMIAQASLPLLEQEARERQRAAGGSKSAPGKSAQSAPPPRRARDDAARAAGVSPRLVQDAKAVASESPDMAARVKAGEVSVGEAKKQLKAPPPPPRKKQSPAELALSDETARRFKDLVNKVHALKREIVALADEPAGREIRKQDVEREMGNIAGWIRSAVPFKACPFRGCTKTCKACKGTGWVNEDVYTNIPKDVKG